MYCQNTIDQAVSALLLLLTAVTATAQWIASWDWTAILVTVAVWLVLSHLNAIRENTRRMLVILEKGEHR
jgi:hypothetical protein